MAERVENTDLRGISVHGNGGIANQNQPFPSPYRKADLVGDVEVETTDIRDQRFAIGDVVKNCFGKDLPTMSLRTPSEKSDLPFLPSQLSDCCFDCNSNE